MTASVLTGVSTSGGSGKNAGSYALTPSGDDANYNLSFVDGGLTINKATVSLSGISKTYDGTTSKGTTSLSISGVNGETLSLGDATYSDANVATAGKYLTALTLADNGSYLASNYQLPALNLSNAAATINKATVSLSGISKTYDGTTSKGNTTLSISGVNGETLS